MATPSFFAKISKRGLKFKYVGFLLRFISAKISADGKIETDGLTLSMESHSGVYAAAGSKAGFGRWAYLCEGTRIVAHDGATVSVGPSFFANRYCSIVGRGGISIGENCMLGEGVLIYDHNYKHKPGKESFFEQGYYAKKIEIGNNVWIGSKAFIGAGVQIGDNVVIGANSVITKNIPSDSMAYSASQLVIKPLEDSKN